MPQGIMIWDASGNLIADYTTRFGRFLGMTTVGTGATTGSVTPGGAGQGDLWYAVLTDIQFRPDITISGNTISWDWSSVDSAPGGSRQSFKLGYGVR